MKRIVLLLMVFSVVQMVNEHKNTHRATEGATGGAGTSSNTQETTSYASLKKFLPKKQANYGLIMPLTPYAVLCDLMNIYDFKASTILTLIPQFYHSK